MRLFTVANALAFVVLSLTGVQVVAHAQVYRCTTSHDDIAYQDRPCPRGARQEVLNLPSRAPPGYAPPASTASAVPPAEDTVPPASTAYVPPASPLPVLYACVGAVNGKRYLARQPPSPYLAPLGVMGYPPQSLAQAYGGRGGAGVSAPEAAPKPRIGGPSMAAAMTEVQDACVPATHVEVCAFVQREYDDNHQKLRAALLPSEQEPLRRRELQLQDQLRNCR